MLLGKTCFGFKILLFLCVLVCTKCPTVVQILRIIFVFQALFVFMALSFARDEIIWLLRHADNMPKKSADDFIDKYVNNLWCDRFNICKNLMEAIYLKAREYEKMVTW